MSTNIVQLGNLQIDLE